MFSPSFHIDTSLAKNEKDWLGVVHTIGKPMFLKKGKQIVKAGTHASFFIYIVSGIFKTYFVTNNKEYIIGFTFKGDIDCCPTALLSSTPNNFTIEAISDCQVLICNLKDFKNYYSEVDYFRLINPLLIQYLAVIENRLAESISQTAEQRYKELLNKQPEEIKKIPLKQIAAYLGITLEGLSRIRRKIKT